MPIIHKKEEEPPKDMVPFQANPRDPTLGGEGSYASPFPFVRPPNLAYNILPGCLVITQSSKHDKSSPQKRYRV